MQFMKLSPPPTILISGVQKVGESKIYEANS
jgi:hypothetical protein